MIHACLYVNSEGTTINLNDGTRFVLRAEGLPGGIYNPVFESLEADVPSDLPAAVWQTYLMKQREIDLTLTALGTPAQIVSSMALLVAVFTPDLRDKARGTLTYIADNGVERAIGCSLANIGDLTGWPTRRQCETISAEIPLKFRCQDPTFYDPTPFVSAPANFAGAGNVNVPITNAGNMPGYLEIIYTGQVEEPRFTDDYGRIWHIEDELTAGDELYMSLDPLAYEITYTPAVGPVENWQNRVSTPSLIPHARPGAHNLVFTAIAGNAAITVATHSRYIAHGIA